MKHLLVKELKMATPLLTYLFLGFTLMTFIPGYPILCGAFFVCFGIFQGYQYSREAGDMAYSVVLPVKKTDLVKAKFVTVCLLQMAALALFTLFTLLRMTFLTDAGIYVGNALMGANFVFLGYVLLIFAIFNRVFVGGFFKTAYNIGKPFLSFMFAGFSVILVAEVLHHLPGMAWLNTLDYSDMGRQVIVLMCGAVLYAGVTILSCQTAQKRFAQMDL